MTEMRFGVGSAALVVIAYFFVVMFGLDALDHFLRPVVYAYKAMRQ